VQRCAACEAEEKKWEASPEAQGAGRVRRKCAECEAKEKALEESPEEEEKRVSRKEAGRGTVGASSRVVGVTRSGGQPLDAETRAYMEPRFGYDFSRVRIHADGEAAIAARSVSAHAYTLGDSVVFGAGRYSPGTTEGRRLLAHELAHVVQQQASGPSSLSRQPAPAPTAPSGTPPLDPQAMLEKDKKAFESATRKVGTRAISVLLHVPKGPEDLKSAETFTIQSVVDRSNGGETRKGFESESLANAYASMNAGPAGATVLNEDNIFFVAKLNPNPNLSLIAHKPSLPSMGVGDILLGSWGGKLVKSDWNKYKAIYRIDPAPNVRMVIGQDGVLFPQSYFNAPDPDGKYRGLSPSSEGGIPTDAGTGGASASQLKPDQLPSSPAAADLRKIAGIDDVGGKTELKPEQQEAFIASYFRSRAEESLNTNEKTATQLQSDFKPATKDDASAPGSPIKKNAKAMIDSSRELAKDLRTILETEAIIKGRLDYVETAISRAVGGPGAMKLTIDGKERLAVDWKADYRSALKEIAAGVIEIRSASPMLALMVPEERKPPPTTTADAVSTGTKVVSGILNPLSLIGNLAADKDVRDAVLNRQTAPKGTNQVDASLFGSSPSAENDEKLRESFEKKLDTTLQAIRRARGEIVHGDLDQLLSLPGLRLQVGADLKKNQALNKKLEDMLAEHEIKEIAWTIAETTVQVGALFLPGGAFISAAIGFGIAARDMGKDLKNLDIASAGAIDPSTALISQQEAESRLVASTLMVALAALDLGSAVMPELHAAKVLTADAEGAKKGFDLEIKSIKGADGVMHEVGMSKIGIRRCSDTCLLLAESLRVRGNELTTVPGNADPAWFALQKEIEPQVNGLKSRAETLNQKAIESYKLPEPARRAEQEKLLREAQEVELEMTKIEHRVFNVRGDKLPSAARGDWLPATPGSEVIPGQGFWMPTDPSHPAYSFCQKNGPIPYDANYPNFTKWVQMEISLPSFTARADDFALADQAMAARLFEKDPKAWGTGGKPNMPDPQKMADYRREFEMTWHHKENSGTLQLVPRALHYVPHSGGIKANVAGKAV
jgi:hypothetical protein